ncbi:hypothetical protein EBR57_10965, partial [bacterium]|nr:hypothetical protein [bacterium]
MVNLRNKEPLIDAIWDWEQPEIEKEIVHFWKSLRQFEKCEPSTDTKKEIIHQTALYTNIANMFSNVGRSIEALQFYEKALKISPNDPQTIGNLGMCLNIYAKSIYDHGHQTIIQMIAYQNLLNAINNPTLIVEAKSIFEAEKHSIISRHTKVEINEMLDWTSKKLGKSYSIGSTKAERSYRKWCLTNGLFLNPLNDLGPYSIASRDIIHLPTLKACPIAEIDKVKHIQGFINCLKQDFISARFKCFEGI